jgi:alkylation response protein AidB-like acyl-CoA dehydrogenase
MDFGWDADQRQRYDHLVTELRAAFPACTEPSFTREKWEVLGKLGVLGASIPARYGGSGLPALEAARVYEAAGYGCPDTGLVFAAAAHLFACAMPILSFANEDLRQRLLPALASGELIAANAITERDAGSDVGRLATTATACADGFRLDGRKTFVSNGPVADILLTYATTDPAAGNWGITAFVVEKGSGGITAGEPLRKLGMDGCLASEVEFSGCVVPASGVLGEPGQGAAIFQHSMSWERTCLFALFLGVQDRLIEAAIARVRQRRQFGRRLAEFQSVSNRIVAMKLRAESARLLLYRACWAMDAGQDTGLFTALSKLAVSESALATATDAVQLFGGLGYLRDHGIEASLRDAVGGTIFSGASDVQRQLAAMELGL